MALDIVRLYISLLSEFFTFSDAGVASSSATEHVPAYVPPTSDSLTTGLYVLRILTEITDCVGEVAGVDISPAASSSLKDLVASARWSFQEAICGAWARDSHIFHKIEDWTLSPDVPSTTIYLNRLATFQLHNTNTAYLVAGGSERSPSSRKTVRYSVALVSRTFSHAANLTERTPIQICYQDQDGLLRHPLLSARRTRQPRLRVHPTSPREALGARRDHTAKRPDADAGCDGPGSLSALFSRRARLTLSCIKRTLGFC